VIFTGRCFLQGWLSPAALSWGAGSQAGRFSFPPLLFLSFNPAPSDGNVPAHLRFFAPEAGAIPLLRWQKLASAHEGRLPGRGKNPLWGGGRQGGKTGTTPPPGFFVQSFFPTPLGFWVIFLRGPPFVLSYASPCLSPPEVFFLVWTVVLGGMLRKGRGNEKNFSVPFRDFWGSVATVPLLTLKKW